MKTVLRFLPKITDELWNQFCETDLMTWDRDRNIPSWTQTAVDFAAIPLPNEEILDSPANCSHPDCGAFRDPLRNGGWSCRAMADDACAACGGRPK